MKKISEFTVGTSWKEMFCEQECPPLTSGKKLTPHTRGKTMVPKKSRPPPLMSGKKTGPNTKVKKSWSPKNLGRPGRKFCECPKK